MKNLTLILLILLVANTTLLAQINLDSLLIGYWPFNGNATDESGNGNDGTVYGATLTVDRFGNANSAYSFDGTNDYISANPVLPISNQDRSISIWFNTTSASGSNGWYVNTMTSWGSPSDNNLCSAAVYKAELMFNAFGVSYSVYTGQIVNDSNWHNTVITYDGEILKVFLDTVEVASESRNLNTVNSSFYIGRRVGQDNQFMDGLIDDIRLYSRALSSEEIDSLYKEEYISSTVEIGFSKYKLEQNFPNPCKVSTSIPYYIQEKGLVTFKVYNALGIEIQAISTTVLVPGNYSIKLNTGNYSNGIYFYKMEINDFVQIRKMLIEN